MHKFLILCFFVPILSGAQIIISDNFNDSNFTAQPPWLGDTADFIINSTGQLQLSSAVAGQSGLFTHSPVSQEAEWEFYLKMDFNPSSGNYSRIYLISDSINPSKGYFLRAGGSSEDRLSLYRLDGVNSVLLWESMPDLLDISPAELRIKVKRITGGIWEIYADTGAVADPLQLLATAIDSTYQASRYFGLECIYTSTRSDKFSFDDFNLQGQPYIDQKPIIIDSVFARDNRHIVLQINEPADTSALDTLNFRLSNYGRPSQINYSKLNGYQITLKFADELDNPDSCELNILNLADTAGNLTTGKYYFKIDDPAPTIQWWRIIDSASIQIQFSESLKAGQLADISNYQLFPAAVFPILAEPDTGSLQYIILHFLEAFKTDTQLFLQINGLQDFFGNVFNDSINFSLFEVSRGSIVINEIMADPIPVVGIFPHTLPGCEYIEIYNSLNFAVSLENWKLKVGNKEYELPFLHLPADSFLIFCREDCASRFPGEILILPLDWPESALSNSGNSLKFISPEGIISDALEYHIGFYSDPAKEEGGWSMERINPHENCPGNDKWRASISEMGGSPGHRNSVMDISPDTSSPFLVKVALESLSSISLHFSESMDSNALLYQAHYDFGGKIEIRKISSVGATANIYHLEFRDEMLADELYHLTFTDSTYSCSGNPLPSDTIWFGIPSVPEVGDLIINELLFNPFSGGADFVEIHNISEKAFDLSTLLLANMENGALTSIKAISVETELILPGDYRAFTEDPENIKEIYHPEKPQNIRKVKELPSMDDKSGSMILASSLLKVIDRVEYEEDWHLSFLKSREGISLEKIYPAGSSTDADNWSSAAYTVNYASPGYRNSQMLKPFFKGKLELTPRLFHPEREKLAISYELEEENNVLSVSIWNMEGLKIRDLISQRNVARRGLLNWDGLNDSGQLQNPGIYIVLFEFYNENQGEKRIVKTCVVSL